MLPATCCSRLRASRTHMNYLSRTDLVQGCRSVALHVQQQTLVLAWNSENNVLLSLKKRAVKNQSDFYLEAWSSRDTAHMGSSRFIFTFCRKSRLQRRSQRCIISLYHVSLGSSSGISRVLHNPIVPHLLAHLLFGRPGSQDSTQVTRAANA